MKAYGPTGIRGRLIFLVVIAVIPLFLLGVGLTVSFVLKEGRADRLLTLVEKPEHISAQIEHSWSGILSDVHFLSAIPPVDGVVRAWAHNGVDPLDGRTERSWRDSMARTFTGVIETKLIYDQIRCLNRHGQEVVRVEFRNGHGVRVPDEQLRDERDQRYFTETSKLASGRYYISPVDLTQAGGKITGPRKAIVQVAIPVFNPEGQFQGMVIANVLFDEVCKLAMTGHLTPLVTTFLADESGNYLYHSDYPAKAWGGPHDLNTGKSVKKDYPVEWATMLRGESSIIKTRDGVMVIRDSEPWPGTGRFLVVCAVIPDSILSPPGMTSRLTMVVLTALGLLVVIIALVIWPLGHQIVVPISVLVQAVERFKAGDYSARAPTGRHDEIGRLAQSFNDMADTIARERDQLEQQVHDRTAKLLSLTRAIEQSPATVLITDIEGRIVYVNPKFEQLTGYSVAEAMGQNPRILNSRTQPPEIFVALWKALAAGQEWHGEICNRKKNGEIFWEWASISPVRDASGKIAQFVAVKEDITERKKAAEELVKAKEAADDANRAKSDFLASMSHELRTPLGAIIGFSELLEEELFGELNPKQAEYVKDILESGRHLLSLINDILDLAKVEAGKMELELSSFSVGTLLENSLVMVKEKCLKHGIRLALDIGAVEGLPITADARKLKQVMLNLLSNAAKFTPDGGAITVSASLERAGEGAPGHTAVPELRISVIDTGIGIAKEYQAKVFEEFYQVSGGDKGKTPGTGLGLPLSRRLVELHGGRLWVESPPNPPAADGTGKGSAFRFTIPVRNHHEETHPDCG